MENELLNGFEVFANFTPGKNNSAQETNIESTSVEQELLEDIKIPNKLEDTTNEDETNVDEPIKEDPKQVEEQNQEKEEDIDDNLYGSFFDVMNDTLGIDLGEDVDKPKSPEELVKYFQTVIEQKSKPVYASDDLYQLDQYVRNGGDIRNYFKVDGGVDYETLDMEDESNQKMVLQDFLKEKGFTQAQISKKLEKYEEAGLLEDEAGDAYESMKQIVETKKQTLLQEQQKQADAIKEQNQQYFNSVVTELKGMEDIRGVKIPETDKSKLLDYIFKPDANGVTQFSKDWSSNNKHLLETAYFIMKGDALISAAKTQGSNSAIEKFKNSLSRQGISRNSSKTTTTVDDSLWNSFAQKLRN